MTHPDPALEARIDAIIAKIAAAQEEDGYLYTARTIDPANPPVDWVGPERWSNLPESHELYNLGHFYEAADAYFRATGKKASSTSPSRAPTSSTAFSGRTSSASCPGTRRSRSAWSSSTA